MKGSMDRNNDDPATRRSRSGLATSIATKSKVLVDTKMLIDTNAQMLIEINLLIDTNMK